LETARPLLLSNDLGLHGHCENGDKQTLVDLENIPELGNDCKGVFEKRLVQIKEDERMKKGEGWTPYQCIETKLETSHIMRFTFRCTEPLGTGEKIKLGSHVSVRLPGGIQRAYAVVSGTKDCFDLAVARDENSRGGSVYLHNALDVGQILLFGPIKQSLSEASGASHYILIAGGVGITAFLIMVQKFQEMKYSYELHYCVGSAEDLAFKKKIADLGDNVTVYYKSQRKHRNITRRIYKRKWNSHVYICGPQPMIDEVLKVATDFGMDDDEIHIERFKADARGRQNFLTDIDTPVVLYEGWMPRKIRGKLIKREETLLEVLREVGFEIGGYCDVGVCENCRIDLKAGEVEHAGSALSDEEKKSQILTCVSRGKGHIIVEPRNEKLKD